MYKDLAVGIIAGLLQGWLLRPLYAVFFRNSVRLASKAVRNAPALVIFGSLVAMLGLGCFFVMVLLLQPFVNEWQNFRIGWAAGFAGGALAYLAIGRGEGRR